MIASQGAWPILSAHECPERLFSLAVHETSLIVREESEADWGTRVSGRFYRSKQELT